MISDPEAKFDVTSSISLILLKWQFIGIRRYQHVERWWWQSFLCVLVFVYADVASDGSKTPQGWPKNPQCLMIHSDGVKSYLALPSKSFIQSYLHALCNLTFMFRSDNTEQICNKLNFKTSCFGSLGEKWVQHKFSARVSWIKPLVNRERSDSLRLRYVPCMVCRLTNRYEEWNTMIWYRPLGGSVRLYIRCTHLLC